MWQKDAKFKGAEYFRKALYIKQIKHFKWILKNIFSRGQKLRMTQILIFTKSAASVCMMAIYIYSRMLWRVIRLIAKFLFAIQMNWIPKKHFHCISVLPRKDQLTSCQWLSRLHRCECWRGQGWRSLCHADWVWITDWKLQKKGGAWNHCSSSVNHGYLQYLFSTIICK